MFTVLLETAVLFSGDVMESGVFCVFVGDFEPVVVFEGEVELGVVFVESAIFARQMPKAMVSPTSEPMIMAKRTSFLIW